MGLDLGFRRMWDGVGIEACVARMLVAHQDAPEQSKLDKPDQSFSPSSHPATAPSGIPR